MPSSEAQTSIMIGESWPVSIRYAVAVLPTLILSTVFFFDALFMDQSIVHGDSLVHGLSVIDYHAKVLGGQESALWSEKLFGGHPVFAESQFGFLSPLNNIVASVMSPITAHNVFHWCCLLLSGMGMLALSFRMNLSLVAAMFASTAVVTSGMWLDQQQNLAISGALLWIPWALWALERWLANPRAFLALAATIVLMVFAGYPQMLHATLTFIFVSLVSVFLSREEFMRIIGAWRRYLAYGLVAVFIAVGLSAIQLLPMLELIGQSHRSEGIYLVTAPVGMMFRGMIYASGMEDTAHEYFWLMASALVCVLASLVLCIKPLPRIVGYIIATLFMLNLGLGAASPLFMLIYDYYLLPGLHNFRIVWPFVAPAIVGLAIIAGTVLDALPTVRFSSARVIPILGVLAAGWTAIFYRWHEPMIPVTHYLILLALLVACVVLVLGARRRWLGLAVLIALLTETSLLKLDLMNFHPRALFETPSTVEFLRENGDLENYRVHDVSLGGTYTFVPPRHENMPGLVENMLTAVTPSSNLLWDIKGWGGAHALPLRGRILLEPVVAEEITGVSADRSGFRFVDILGMRYITTSQPLTGAGFELIFHADGTPVEIYENPAALPRFQSYQSWEFIDSEDEALLKNQAADQLRLWVERPESPVMGAGPPRDVHQARGEGPELAITLVSERSTNYEFDIVAADARWFFMSDANYPGWNATLDGQPTTVYTAQILGKAVWIPEGKHRLRIWFESGSFRIGAIISLVTLALLLMGLLGVRLRQPNRNPE